MATVHEIKSALLTWAVTNGILADNVQVEATGDLDLVPFPEESIEFFRTRKIVRVVADTTDSTVTLYSRLKIAGYKQKQLIETFAERYQADGIRLNVDFTKPFKIDQSLASFGELIPVRYHEGKIACGSSVGLGNQRNAGTLTALATRKGDNRIFGISCNHVTGGCGTARPGTPVVVPGIQDVNENWKDIEVIGDHDSAATMSQGLPSIIDSSRNRDLAFFSIRNPDKLSSMQGSGTNAYDTPTSFVLDRDLKPSTPVKKWGRSTGFTTGDINRISDDDEPIPYEVKSFFGPMASQTFRGTVYFYNVIEIISFSSKPFSLSGDSGSLVVTNFNNKVNRVVGIVIAGEKDKSIVLPLKPVLLEYGLCLLNDHNV